MRVQELFELHGKTAIVTGGGSGIGRQMAGALAELGANVVLCARKVERCEQAAAELSTLDVQTLALQCDVRKPDDVRSVVERTVAELGGVDVLVNNAGTAWGAPAEDTPLEGWQKVVDVNLTGVFLFSQAAGRSMIAARNGGSIVNIASVAGAARRRARWTRSPITRARAASSRSRATSPTNGRSTVSASTRSRPGGFRRT
jgi:NAD(P)-dependent dehydrogenase (short-subunit alcohol dehydrogenase family)